MGQFRTPQLVDSAHDENVTSRRMLDSCELAPSNLPRRNPLAVLGLNPTLPVRPPGSWMLLGLFEPGLKLSRGRSAGPVLIPFLRRRVHDPGDVARAGKDNPDWTGKELSTQDHRARRCDMVLPGRQVIDWDLHLREVEGHTPDFYAALRKIVVQVTATQIEAVVRRGHPRRIRVPVQQVEGQRLFALHVDVHDVRPD